MNIIELFEALNIDRTKVSSFTSEEIIRIEKQVNIEKKLNPNIETKVCSDLIEALRAFPEEFLFLLDNRILFNFFAKKNYSRNSFPLVNIPISNDRVSLFISQFLEEELTLFFDKSLMENKFEEMDFLLEMKAYFPEELIYNVHKKALGKIEFAVTLLRVNPREIGQIPYVQTKSFYKFLKQLRTIELDDKLKLLLNELVKLYNINKKSEFATISMIEMSNYEAYDDSFSTTIQHNKRVVESNRGLFSSKGSSGIPWSVVAGLVFVLVRIIVAVGNSGSNSSSNSYYDYNQIQNQQSGLLDTYYTDMKYRIDSFHVFLTDFNPKEIKQLKVIDTIKTGQNPFQTFYKRLPQGESSNTKKIKNSTKYDIVVLENAIVYDSIKTPIAAYFVKSGETLEVAGIQTYTVFNFYLGKKLASFQTASNHLFIRNNSIVEYRFSELSPNTKKIIKNDYRIGSDVVIKMNAGQLQINSKESKEIQPINPPKEDIPVVEEIKDKPEKK